MLDVPTMVCGVDQFTPTSVQHCPFLGFCSSYNKPPTKFWSKALPVSLNFEFPQALTALIKKAIEKFAQKQKSGQGPERVIIYRVGASLEQSMEEATMLDQALQGLQWVFIHVRRQSSTYIFA